MRPELFEDWNRALDSTADAEELWAAGRLQDAAERATMALCWACRAIKQLSKGLNIPALSEIASSLLLEVFAKRDKHHTPKELMEWARATLKLLHSELPPDTFPPPRV